MNNKHKTHDDRQKQQLFFGQLVFFNRFWSSKIAMALMVVLINACSISSDTSKKDQQPMQQPSQPKMKPPVEFSDSTPTKPLTSARSANEVYRRYYEQWLSRKPGRNDQVNDYQQFLFDRVGWTPPMSEMLRSARSWEECGFEPFELPPKWSWEAIVPTLKLLKDLKDQGIFPTSLEIVSVYRNPTLNECAQGSSGSKHLFNAAMDISVDYKNKYHRMTTEANLCRFWQSYGKKYDFGLGLYATGAIHIDTGGYRTWGSSYASTSSPCHQENL